VGLSTDQFWTGAVTVTAFLLLLVVLSSRVVLFFPGLLAGVGAYLVARRYRPAPLQHRVTLPRACASLVAVGSAFGVLLYFVPTYELGHAWNGLSLLAGLGLSVALARLGDESLPTGLAALGTVLVALTFVSGGSRPTPWRRVRNCETGAARETSSTPSSASTRWPTSSGASTGNDSSSTGTTAVTRGVNRCLLPFWAWSASLVPVSRKCAAIHRAGTPTEPPSRRSTAVTPPAVPRPTRSAPSPLPPAAPPHRVRPGDPHRPPRAS